MQIAHAIAGDAFWHEDRCSWIAPVPEARGSVTVRPVDGSLFSGTAGIALFLAEAHAVDPHPRLRRTCEGALRHALRRAHDPSLTSSPGLYTGSLGVVLAARRIASRLDKPGIFEAALDLVEPTLDGPPPDETDLLDGLAGIVIGRLALRHETGDDLEVVIDLCDEIVERARRDDGALSWATGPADERSGDLLGLAHGASGIAVALTSVGAAAERGDLRDAALGAARYERGHFDQRLRNWPDFRIDPSDRSRGPNFMWAWCHGAPGIAVARLAIAGSCDDPTIERDARLALDCTAEVVRRTVEADGADFCLCHGLAGNADVLLYAARLTGDASWALVAEDVAAGGIARYHERGTPWPCGQGRGSVPSLFVGTAGIGHFLLRVADPTIPSVLAVDTGIASLASDHQTQWRPEEVL